MKTKIVELLNQNVSYRKIQEQLGCSRSTISYHAEETKRSNYSGFV